MPAFDPALQIPPVDGEVAVVVKLPFLDSIACDGFLPSSWFGGHVWTWNYPQQVLMMEGKGWQPPEDTRVLPLRFKTASDGTRENNFPSLHVEIDGDELPMLFDTGGRCSRRKQFSLWETGETPGAQIHCRFSL